MTNERWPLVTIDGHVFTVPVDLASAVHAGRVAPPAELDQLRCSRREGIGVGPMKVVTVLAAVLLTMVPWFGLWVLAQVGIDPASMLPLIVVGMLVSAALALALLEMANQKGDDR